MPEASRTYWLTTACRIRRKDQSLVIERDGHPDRHIPVTDVRDIIASENVDVNTAVVALLNQHAIDVHLLSYYGDYAGSLLGAQASTSGETVIAQVRLAGDDARRMAIARQLVISCAFNVRRVVDRTLLDRSYQVLKDSAAGATCREQLMGAEGTFRRSAWELMDTKLPDWLQLHGRSRRPPRNAGNAFISYVNGIVYSRVLTALRLTPLHTGIGFLHSTMERHRHTLALDVAEVFKPLFAERLLLRLASRRQLQPQHFETTSNQASLSEEGRRLVVQTVRDDLATTVQHRQLQRLVAYDELIYHEALRLTRTCLEDVPYKAFRIWW
ncbi:MAG: type I-B CRISPR-associated endonuclease Cas1b [Pseudonocardiaceae bacterium]